MSGREVFRISGIPALIVLGVPWLVGVITIVATLYGVLTP